MKKIASFEVDHTKFGIGMYISRIDGDVITYDVRMVKPNGGVYISNPSLHTIEHLFATYVRNSKHGKEIIYAGPMGCRTGFYLLTRDTMSHAEALRLVQEAMAFISAFDAPIPGAQYSRECGNYLDHDLPAARAYARDYAEVLKDWRVEKMHYEA